MDYLPTVGWSDVATKADLTQMATELRSEMRVLSAEVRSEMHKGQRDIIFAMIASNVSIAGLAIAVSQLL